jgi:hypothetical protein
LISLILPCALSRRGRLLILAQLVVLPILYILAALKIAYDTGYAPWDLQFLAMFVPVVLLGEQVIREFASRCSDTGST